MASMHSRLRHLAEENYKYKKELEGVSDSFISSSGISLFSPQNIFFIWAHARGEHKTMIKLEKEDMQSH